jgi:hypothetical protein
MNVLLWHVHGSWTTSFVQGTHEYVLPVTPDRGPYGRGRARTWSWPDNVREVPPERLAAEPIDVVILQRMEELSLVERWLGRTPGNDLPAVYVEHNTPRGDVPNSRHPLAERSDIRVVHVTGFNDLIWDCGEAPTTVIEHGVIDPGPCYTGEIEHVGVVVNDPVRRGRVTGTDLLPRMAERAPVDVFGMGVAGLSGPDLTAYDDLPQHRMHAELARRRVYAHPMRWTSLGLSLLEAMHLGMPVVALGTTEAAEAIPSGAGIVTTRLGTFLDALCWLMENETDARRIGSAGRAAALDRYGIHRFLSDWDALLKEVAS